MFFIRNFDAYKYCMQENYDEKVIHKNVSIQTPIIPISLNDSIIPNNDNE